MAGAARPNAASSSNIGSSGEARRPLYAQREVHLLSIAIAAGIALILIAIIAIPIIISVVGSAGSRNQNRAENEEDRARQERDSGEQNS
jgi:hypothetical protein